MTRRIMTVALAALTFAACGKKEPAPQAAAPAPPAAPNIQTRELEYTQGTTKLKGYIAWDANRAGKQPGVLVIHEWWGHNEHARAQARRLAEAGYVGFALDMFGDGKVTTHPDSAQAFMMEAVKNQPVMVARFNAALEQLKQDPHVDGERIGVIGYCFGGGVALAMARTGADLDAVATFHGGLSPLPPADSGKVKPRILVMTGADDPMVPATVVETFRKEMAAAGARVEIITYPAAKHGFTNTHADSVGMPGLAYNADVDRQSWAEMLKMFAEVFPR